MTSVVGVYLLSGSARLVHMGVSVCARVFCGLGDGARRKRHHWLVPQMLSQTKGRRRKDFYQKRVLWRLGCSQQTCKHVSQGKQLLPSLWMNTHTHSSTKTATKINLSERGERGKSEACRFPQRFEFPAIITSPLLTASSAVCPGKPLPRVAAEDLAQSQSAGTGLENVSFGVKLVVKGLRSRASTGGAWQ